MQGGQPDDGAPSALEPPRPSFRVRLRSSATTAAAWPRERPRVALRAALAAALAAALIVSVLGAVGPAGADRDPGVGAVVRAQSRGDLIRDERRHVQALRLLLEHAGDLPEQLLASRDLPAPRAELGASQRGDRVDDEQAHGVVDERLL